MNSLERQCHQAAQDFLSLDWGNQKLEIRRAVYDVVAGSARYSYALGWLLDQIQNVPVQYEPSRRLNDLVHASAALKKRVARRHLVEQWTRRAA
jgi:hypothetical protein